MCIYIYIYIYVSISAVSTIHAVSFPCAPSFVAAPYRFPTLLAAFKCLYLSAGPMFILLDLCVSSLRRGHANLLCIVPMLTDDPRRQSA